jgi:DNA-binding response OmpR family regulator
MERTSGRILLADDERNFGISTSRVLEHHGWGCDWVATAHEVRAKMAEHPYDVLIADIKMPGNDQLELVESVCKGPEYDSSVILVTGYPSVDTAIRSMDLGAYAYLVKPFDMDEFMGKVGEAQRRTSLQRRMDQRSAVMRDLNERIQALREELSGRPTHSMDQTACEYLKLLLLNIGDTAMEATDLICTLSGEEDQPVRQLTSDPEAESLRQAVEETVEVLERTKNSFKSKELGSLRRRLNKLLELTT